MVSSATAALDMARTVLGKTEGRDRAALIDYLKTGGQNLDPATTAWCASFVNASLNRAGYSGTGSDMARSFMKWGQAVSPDAVQAGDIAVFSRGNDPNLGHVGFVEAVDPKTGMVTLLSGNTGGGAGGEDQVGSGQYAINSALGFRRAGPGQSAAPAWNANDPQQQWMQSMWQYAQAVGQQTGIDPRVVMAQAALESGYGKSAPGYNYFGIKGPGSTQKTLEFINGKMQPTQAAFRGYNSAEESFQDYGKLLMGARYADVRAGKTMEEQIAALGKSGYATDPEYAAKLLKIAQGIPQGADTGTAPATAGTGPDIAKPQKPTETLADAKQPYNIGDMVTDLGSNLTAGGGTANKGIPNTPLPKPTATLTQPTEALTLNPQSQQAARDRLAMAMARLNSGKLWVG